MDEEKPKHMVPYTEIRYVGMGEITIYLVSDDELRMLERGGPASTYLNLAIFFLSMGASFLASLLLSQPKSIGRFIIVIALTVGCSIAGVVLGVVWRRSSRDAADTVQRIRARSVPSVSGNIIESSGSR